ncbi:MAG: ribosome rescue protein RqcH [Candidatus Bathycorpusculaceae bacterium]
MQKKEFTSFDVAAVARELQETILDSRVSNIYQVNGKTLIFKLHKAETSPLQLVLEAGRRLNLTSYAFEKPQVPPAFCMALRKYLRNSWLANVEQYEFERVVVFHFRTKGGEMRLVLEIFGDGNIILVGENGKILHALVYKRMRDRQIVRGESFLFAPSSGRNPFKVSPEELQSGLKSFDNVEVVRALARFLSIGGIYAEEVLLRAGIRKTKQCKELSDIEIGAIFNHLQILLSKVLSDKLEPSIVLDEKGGFLDVTPFKLKRYERQEHKPYTSFNAALDDFYAKVAVTEKTAVSLKIEELKRESERLRRVIESQEQALAEAEAKTEYYRRVGDTIYVHANELQAFLERFMADKKAGKSWENIVSEILTEKKGGLKPSVFFESFNERSLTVSLCVNGLRFSLNLRGKVFEDAGRFYEQSKRAKQKVDGAKAALEETRKKLMKVEAKIRETQALEQVEPAEVSKELERRKIKRKEWFEKFRWFRSSDGFLVLAGKDAVSNEVLIKKYTDEHDIIFHADVAGAPFVVIKTEGKEPTQQCLQEAGEFAAAYSRGWREGFGTVDVYWVEPEQISKKGPSGEYIPRGAFMVTGKRNWIRNIPLKTAIGTIKKENGDIAFISGPIGAVKAKTNIYVTVIPGKQSGKELFKRILAALAEKAPKESRDKILKASLEEIRDFVPYARGRVLS